MSKEKPGRSCDLVQQRMQILLRFKRTLAMILIHGILPLVLVRCLFHLPLFHVAFNTLLLTRTLSRHWKAKGKQVNTARKLEAHACGNSPPLLLCDSGAYPQRSHTRLNMANHQVMQREAAQSPYTIARTSQITSTSTNNRVTKLFLRATE